MERITVKETAKMLGISQQAVRILMEQHVLEIGIVVGGKKKALSDFQGETGRDDWKKEANE